MDAARNATQLMIPPNSDGGVVATITNAVSTTTVACATAAVGVGWWLYEKTITNPLRVLYFNGFIWGNMPEDEICHSLTGVPAVWWSGDPEHMEKCIELLERKFHSWDVSVMSCMYFTLLLFVVLHVLCTCFCIRPIARALQTR